MDVHDIPRGCCKPETTESVEATRYRFFRERDDAGLSHTVRRWYSAELSTDSSASRTVRVGISRQSSQQLAPDAHAVGFGEERTVREWQSALCCEPSGPDARARLSTNSYPR